MNIFVLVLHGLCATLLLGAITHQALGLWYPAPATRRGWWSALRAVHPERFVGATIVLFCVAVLLGAVAYAPFRVITRVQYLDGQAPWATGLFEVKEHAAAIGLALLPAYWAVWQESNGNRGRRWLTTFLAALIWSSFLAGQIVNFVRGR